MKLSGNTILITGGASGIGAGLSERFISEGNKVIVCGRRKEVLNDFVEKNPSAVAFQCDVSTEQGRIDLCEFIATNHPETNVLINNAGIQNRITIDSDDFIASFKQETAINIEAPVHLTYLFLKRIKLSTVINISSGLAFVPIMLMPVYCATKAFVHSFSLSLREFLKDQDIEVIEIIPPAINTDLGGKGLHDFAPPVSEFIAAVFEQLPQGKEEVTFGMTELLSNADRKTLQDVFHKINDRSQLPSFFQKKE